MLRSELHKHNKSAFRECGLLASSIGLTQDITLSKIHLVLAQPKAPELMGALSRSSASWVPGTQIFPWLLSKSQGTEKHPQERCPQTLADHGCAVGVPWGVWLPWTWHHQLFQVFWANRPKLQPPIATSIALHAHIHVRLHHSCFLNCEAFEVEANVCCCVCVEPSPSLGCLREPLLFAGAHLAFWSKGVI